MSGDFWVSSRLVKKAKRKGRTEECWGGFSARVKTPGQL